MANSLGSLIVSLGLDAASFTSGLTKSEYQAKQFGVVMDRAITAGIIKAEIALRAFGAAAEFAFGAFKTLTTGASQFADLADKTGETAENLASLAVASAVAGVSMEDIAGAANKLTKNLVGVDDESKAAGAALAALNININDFKRLSPVEQYKAVSKALEGYADGAGKVAVAQALFGKAGAEQLRVFKALQDIGGTQVILTQRQIDQADAYHDRQAKTTELLKLYAQAAATQALPAITDLTNASVEFIKALTGIGDSADKSKLDQVAKFAEDATDALAFMVDAGQGAVRIFRAVGQEIQIELGFIKEWKRNGLEAAQALVAAARNLQAADFAAPLFSQQLFAARAARKEMDKLRAVEDRGFTPAGKKLDFAGALSGANASAARSFTDYAIKIGQAIGGMIESSDPVKIAEINDQLKKLNELAAAGLDPGIVSNVRAALIAKLPAQLESATEAFRRFEIAGTDAVNNALATDKIKAYNDEQERFNRLIAATPTAQLKRQAEDMESLIKAFGEGKLEPQQFAEAMHLLNDTAKDTKDIAQELGLTFTSAFEDAIVQGKGLSEVIRGLEKDILRIVTRQLITKPLAEGISSFISGAGGGSGIMNSIGSYFSSIFGGGKAAGGPVNAGMMYRVNEHGPEMLDVAGKQFLMMGNDRGRIYPNPQTGSRTQSINNYFTLMGAVDMRTQNQIAAAAARGVATASLRLN